MTITNPRRRVRKFAFSLGQIKRGKREAAKEERTRILALIEEATKAAYDKYDCPTYEDGRVAVLEYVKARL